MTNTVYTTPLGLFLSEKLGAVAINLNQINKNIGNRKRLQKLLRSVKAGDRVIIEFGADDCSHNWKGISRNASGLYLPRISPDDFIDSYRKVIRAVREKGACPILLGLPPVDSEKYFTYISEGLGKQNIISWLGGNYLYISNIHEQYSEALKLISQESACQLIDIAHLFAGKKDIGIYFEDDGFRLNDLGYTLIEPIVEKALK